MPAPPNKPSKKRRRSSSHSSDNRKRHKNGTPAHSLDILHGHPTQSTPALTAAQHRPKNDSHIHPFFDSSLPNRINEVISSGLAKGTLSNYRSAVSMFQRFCDNHLIHRKLRLPSDEYVLCLFAASLAGTYSGSHINSVFSGLKSWHITHNAVWRGGHRVQLLLRGATRLAPPSSMRDPRKPVTIGMLLVLRNGLNRDCPRDIAVFAVALVAFWAQCRLGELLGSSRRRHDPHLFPSRSSFVRPSSSSGSYELHLPHTKSNQVSGETVIITKQSQELDPVNALRYHLSLIPNGSPALHLFSFQLPGKSHINIPTKESFLSRVNEIWAQAGFPRMTGHSFRIGGTSALLKAGVPPDVVRSMGRWSSDAHFRYWRDLFEIATMHAEHLPEQPRQLTANERRPPTRGRTSSSSHA